MVGTRDDQQKAPPASVASNRPEAEILSQHHLPHPNLRSRAHLTVSGWVSTLHGFIATRAGVVGLECLRCHAVFEERYVFTGCPACRAQGAPVNLAVKLDLSPLQGLTPERFPITPRGLWRFSALLPVVGD